MTSEINPQFWHSGDWKIIPSKESPFNGIELTGAATYKNERLVAVKLVFTDYTDKSTGSEVVIPELTLADGKVQIMAPVEKTSPPSSLPNPNFTIQGWVALEANNLDLSLRIQLSYGLEHARKEGHGYIMSFSVNQVD